MKKETIITILLAIVAMTGQGQIHPKNFKIHPLLTDFTEKEAEKRQKVWRI